MNFQEAVSLVQLWPMADQGRPAENGSGYCGTTAIVKHRSGECSSTFLFDRRFLHLGQLCRHKMVQPRNGRAGAVAVALPKKSAGVLFRWPADSQ